VWPANFRFLANEIHFFDNELNICMKFNLTTDNAKFYLAKLATGILSNCINNYYDNSLTLPFHVKLFCLFDKTTF